MRDTAALLCLLLGLCLGTSAPAQTADALTEDQVTHDPDVKAQVGQTGEYRLAVKAVPYRLYIETLDHFNALKDRNQARQAGKKHAWMAPEEGVSDFTYEVWVPESYAADKPAGLVVYINSSNNGTLKKGYRELLGRKNMLVIGANQSGNDIDTGLRLTYAFYAVELMKRRYAIDDERVYITGSSGGGRAASHAMFYRPGLFKGGLPMIGCMAPIENGNKAYQLGTPPMHAMPSKAALKEAAKNGRYVLFTGEKDYNRKECEATAKYLNDMGFRHATVMVQPGLGHGNASPEYFEKALDFVDAPLIDRAKATVEDAQKDLQRNRLTDAAEKLQQAAAHLGLGTDEETQALAKEAAAQLAGLEQQYTDAIAAIEQALADKDAKAAQDALRAAQRNWRDRLDRATTNAYRKQINEIKRGG